MDEPGLYEIRVEGHLTDRWSEWFAGLAIRNEPNGETTLSGLISDQSALFGVLNKIHALNFEIVLFIFARLLGGKGSFGTQAYLPSIFYAPLSIINKFLR